MARAATLPTGPEVAAIGEVLRTTEGNALKRAHAMKLTPVCSRCCGTGQYSFNQVDGSRCYGCGGNGHTVPRAKDLPGVLERAKAAVAAGELDHYLHGIEARKAAKTGSDRIFAAWRETHVSRVTAGWASHHLRDHELPGNGAAMRAANHLIADAHTRAREAISAATNAKLTDPERDAKALAAQQAVEDCLRIIAEVDIPADAEYAAFAQERQRAAAASLHAKGLTPGWKLYGEAA